jgi:hypothetical protein
MPTINDDIRETASIGLKRLREYLQEPTDDGEKVARVGVQAIRAHTSAESTATRRLSAAISAAKLMGVSGEALSPVFSSLAGTAPQALPSRRERANSTKDTK